MLNHQARFCFTPDETGNWSLGLTVAGQAELYVDGCRIIDHTEDQKADVTFFNTGTEERTANITLVAGKPYEMELRFSNFKQISAMSPYVSRPFEPLSLR